MTQASSVNEPAERNSGNWAQRRPKSPADFLGIFQDGLLPLVSPSHSRHRRTCSGQPNLASPSSPHDQCRHFAVREDLTGLAAD